MCFSQVRFVPPIMHIGKILCSTLLGEASLAVDWHTIPGGKGRSDTFTCFLLAQLDLELNTGLMHK